MCIKNVLIIWQALMFLIQSETPCREYCIPPPNSVHTPAHMGLSKISREPSMKLTGTFFDGERRN